VDELIVFHQRERDAFRSKIYGLESENEHMREELKAMGESLERQCERTRYQQEYADKLHIQHVQMNETQREKEQVVRAQQDLIGDLRLQLEKSEERVRLQSRELQSLKEQVDNALQSEARTQRHY